MGGRGGHRRIGDDFASGWKHRKSLQHDGPNILVIFSDDHAYQAIIAYGDPRSLSTPNIDRIARTAFASTAAWWPIRSAGRAGPR